jgi:hypothetical protein
MGYGAPHTGLMIRMGAWYGDSDEDEDEYDDRDEDEDCFDIDSDSESDVSDWEDSSGDNQQSSATSNDLSIVLTLPLDVIYEVCNTSFPLSRLSVRGIIPSF